MAEIFMINQLMIKSKNTRKLEKWTGQWNDYTTGCFSDYQYFKDHYQLIALDLSKQKELDADPRAIQQIEFNGMLKTNSQVCTSVYNFRKSKRKSLWVLERNSKSFVRIYKWLNTTK